MFKLFKKYNYKANYNQQVDHILSFANDFDKLDDNDLQAKTLEFKKRLNSGESLDDLLPEAYAVVYVASKRVLKLTFHRVQIYGAIVLHNGDVAEMKTGEGKSLTSTMPLYLNALTGLGVHYVTVNDYLAKRDSEEIGELLLWLGISVGYNLPNASKTQKKLSYEQDITYSTHSELGFDYLRDNMVTELKDKVQRLHNYAIVDECDSILIDDARTPLIISGGQKGTDKLYKVADHFVKSLDKEADFEIDLEHMSINLTKSGTKKAESKFRIENLFDIQHTILVHHIQQALKANYTLKEDKDYVVKSDNIAIVDSNTGRILEGRTYSNGLHQALQQKHYLPVTQESKIISTISYQNYFRLYNKLAGMTGTAKTEEEELLDIYNMKVEAIDTNKPVIRIDDNDLIFGTRKGQFDAIILKVKELNSKGQPILIGTRTVEISEQLSQLLRKENLKHQVLNAVNHTRESEIILSAGQKNQITIATNMAGRGADIKLGEGVEKLGGLAVIGVERNESRRIDNQLIGRSGRQGLPGFSKYYISWEDELLVRFAGQRAKQQANMLQGESVESNVITKLIEQAQKRIEGQNFDARKELVQYDDVIRKQRETIYEQRDAIIISDDIEPVVKLMYQKVAQTICEIHKIYIDKEAYIDGLTLLQDLARRYFVNPEYLDANKISNLKFENSNNYVLDIMLKSFNEKKEKFGNKIFLDAKRQIIIEIIDKYWQAHIDTMSKLRSGIHLRAYSQKQPLQIYVEEGFVIFEKMKEDISMAIISAINTLELQK